MVSVLLPVRNGAASLDAALESLRTQTHPVDECVVVDDGSTDSTQAVLSAWSRRWPAIRVISTKGLGLPRALNRGLDEIRGEWIARMDADDLSHPRRIEAQLAEAVRTGASLIGCQVGHRAPDLPIDGRDSPFKGMRRHVDWANRARTHDELEQALWIDSPLPHPSWFVRRDVYAAVGRYNDQEPVPEDYEWLHRFFASARQDGRLRAAKAIVGECNTALLDWTDSSDRLTRTSPSYRPAAFNAVKARAIAALLGERNPDLYVFGLGSKSKALLPTLQSALGGDRIRACVEVNSRKIGTVYNGLSVISVAQWAHATKGAKDPFVVVALGTPETRGLAEQLCRDHGLRPNLGYVAV